ncbi:hypothetical protein POM88_043041 [Heracleum sosnowskyi]|uniref:hAT-like transposase RNase-H fold domain-containing protein n=1 Tax=Heracleum sosnowskyi TaxID=360622 RepID=A0AAD8HK09_9APIA|nr:hypothetical protein POM88_043041 [Heracleum sosnowskyi]
MDGADMDGANKEPNNQQSEQQNQDQEGTLKKNKNSKVSSSKRQKPSKDAKGGEDSSRKRKNSSPWWDHYDKTDDPDFAKCFVLSQHLHHEDEIVRKMAAHMKLKYEKYWGNIDKLNLFMFISVILDPRRKMVYVDWMIKAWFGIERAENLSLNIKSTFSSLFEFYASSMPDPNITAKSRSSSSTSASSFQSKDKENEKMFDFSEFLGSTFGIEVGGGISEKKVEWERYLEDERESNESCPNVLQWWKDNKNRYGELDSRAASNTH